MSGFKYTYLTKNYPMDLSTPFSNNECHINFFLLHEEEDESPPV